MLQFFHRSKHGKIIFFDSIPEIFSANLNNVLFFKGNSTGSPLLTWVFETIMLLDE